MCADSRLGGQLDKPERDAKGSHMKPIPFQVGQLRRKPTPSAMPQGDTPTTYFLAGPE